MNIIKKALAIALAAAATITLSSCSDAEIASNNLSRESDNFRIARRVVFFNGITDEYMLSIEGFCSIYHDAGASQLEVTCRTEDGHKKHFLGLSDNVTYFVEQLDDAEVSETFYSVNFKPTIILPKAG